MESEKTIKQLKALIIEIQEELEQLKIESVADKNIYEQIINDYAKLTLSYNKLKEENENNRIGIDQVWLNAYNAWISSGVMHVSKIPEMAYKAVIDYKEYKNVS